MDVTLNQVLGTISIALFAGAPILVLFGWIDRTGSAIVMSAGSALLALSCLVTGMPEAALSCVAIAACARVLCASDPDVGKGQDVELVLIDAIQAFATVSMVSAVPVCGTDACAAAVGGMLMISVLGAIGDQLPRLVRDLAHRDHGYPMAIAAAVSMAVADILAPTGPSITSAISRGRLAEAALCIGLVALSARAQYWEDEDVTVFGWVSATLTLTSLTIGLARIGDLATGVSLAAGTAVMSISAGRRARGTLLTAVLSAMAAIAVYAIHREATGATASWPGPVEGLEWVTSHAQASPSPLAVILGGGISSDVEVMVPRVFGATWPFACVLASFGVFGIASLGVVAICAVCAGVRRVRLGKCCTHASFLCVSFGVVALVALASTLGLCPCLQEHPGMAFLCVDSVTGAPTAIAVAVAISLVCDHGVAPCEETVANPIR